MSATTLGSDRLQRNALSLPQIIASTLANIAPAVGFYFGFGVIVGGAGVAAPLTIYLFIGWENTATLAEEAENPRRNIPLAMFIGTLTIGVVYIFIAYATEIAFHNKAAAIAASTIPFIDGLKASYAGLLIIAYIAGITSIFSCLIGLTNSQARILFSAGREGLVPPIFGRINRKYKTPQVAMWTYILVSLAIVLVFGWNLTPIQTFGDTGTLGAIPVIVVYVVTNVALPVYMLRFHRSDFNPVRHAVIPLLGTILILFPLWELVQPGQPAPFNLFPKLVLVGLVVSLIYGAILARMRPDLASRIGSFIADQEI